MAPDSRETTISERRREQNRRAQRKFRERHGKRAYERCPPPSPPLFSPCEDNEAELETKVSRQRSISSSVPPPDIPVMAFSTGSDTLPPTDLMNFNDADSFSGLEVDPDLFTLVATPPHETLDRPFPPLAGGRGSHTSHHSITGDHSFEPKPTNDTTQSQSPLHMAVQRGSAKIVSLLLKHGADCNTKDHTGLTPLMHASIGGHVEIVEILLANGATLTCADEHQQSPLHWAVMHRREGLLKSLLKHCKGSSQIVNAYNLDGQTPLHMAIDLGFETAVEELLHSGASVGCSVREPQVTSPTCA